jgi:hypothetical protein
MEALQLGSVQMLAPSLAKFGPLGVKEFEVFDLPYIFDNYDELHKVTQGPIGKSLLAKLEPKGIEGLAYWDNGFKSFSANRPLHVPADYRGLKMRIQSSKVLDAQMRALGALPQVLALAGSPASVRGWVVRWDVTGQNVVVWVADPGSTEIGRLSLFSVDGGSGQLVPTLAAGTVLSTICFDDGSLVYTSAMDGKTYMNAVPVLPSSSASASIGAPGLSPAPSIAPGSAVAPAGTVEPGA